MCSNFVENFNKRVTEVVLHDVKIDQCVKEKTVQTF